VPGRGGCTVPRPPGPDGRSGPGCGRVGSRATGGPISHTTSAQG
jgi:hypothetical protein